jgi:hypothetical protein
LSSRSFRPHASRPRRQGGPRTDSGSIEVRGESVPLKRKKEKKKKKKKRGEGKRKKEGMKERGKKGNPVLRGEVA